jgi:hypothetical protein
MVIFGGNGVAAVRLTVPKIGKRVPYSNTSSELVTMLLLIDIYTITSRTPAGILPAVRLSERS